MPQKILLIGAYGQNNIGDDALLEVFLDHLKGDDVIVNSAQPEITEATYGVKAVPTYFRVPRYSFIRAILDADLIVFGGGSLLKEIEGPSVGRIIYLLRILGLVGLAKLTQGKTAMISVGIGPLHGRSYRQLSRLCANWTDFITVRDEPSKALLSEIQTTTNVIATADVVLTVPAVSPQKDQLPSGSRRVAVIPRYSLTQEERQALALSCDHIVEQYDAQIVFVPFQQGFRPRFDDEVCALDILGRMRNPHAASVETPSRVDETMNLLSGVDLVISARLHGLILGGVQNVPVIALGYDMKVQSFMAKLGQAQSCIDLDQLVRGDLNAVVDRDWVNLAETKEKIRPIVAELSTNASRSFSLLAEERRRWEAEGRRPLITRVLFRSAVVTFLLTLALWLHHRSS